MFDEDYLKKAAANIVAVSEHILWTMPIAIPAAIAAFGTVATLLLLGGNLRSPYVWPLGLLAAVLVAGTACWFYRDKRDQSVELRICNVLVLLGVLVWGKFNAIFASQHVITNRDPGVYANTGLWLIHHISLNIPIAAAFGNMPGLEVDSGGFSVYFVHHVPHLYAQGLHLLPIFLGLAGRIGGAQHMFQVNVIFGMTALLAVYGFARFLVRPYWAMVAVAALAASMPFLYFSRDTYTEPLAATLTFGALSLLCMAIKSNKTLYWLLAGLVAGAGTLTRIDAFLTVAGVLLFLVVYLATEDLNNRSKAIRNSIAIVSGMAVTSLIGWLDASRLSTPYYVSTQTEFYREILLILFILIAGLITIYYVWHSAAIAALDRATKRWRSEAIAAAIIFIVIVLASRPLWLRAMNATGGGLSTGPVRSLAELSTEWVSWYLGPLLAIMGVIGLIIAAVRVAQKRDLVLLASLIIIGLTSLVYLVKPSIAPDQIWAARRLMPVILPGIAVFGLYALEYIQKQYFNRLQWKWFFMIGAGVALLLGPLITSRPEILLHDTNLYSPVKNVCRSLPNNSAVLWIGAARTQLIQPTRELCNVPAEGFGALYSSTGVPSKQFLAKIAQNARVQGYVPVVGAYGKDAHLIPSSLTTVSSYTYSQLESPSAHPPEKENVFSNVIQIGIIQPDGSVTAL